jgi:AraC-like DNA-binding protein
MPDAGYVTSSYSRIVARELNLHERDLPRLLAGTDLSRDVLLMPGDETRLSGEQQLRVLQNARRLSGNPDLGLRIGQQLQPSAHGPIGYLALSSPDLITALKALRDYLPLRIGFAQLNLEFCDEWMLCTLSISLRGEATEMRMLKECFALLLQSLVESLLGRQLNGAQFGFDFPQPEYAGCYHDYLHAPISFGEHSSFLRLPANLALQANAHGDPGSYALARDLCQRLLAQLPATALSVSDRVRRLLLSQPAGAVTEEGIARALFVSKRTLARRLASEDTGYRQIREDLYAELAANHLREGGLTVESIAILLGYHDTATFRRAFRRWYGVPPGEYRRTNENSPGLDTVRTLAT